MKLLCKTTQEITEKYKDPIWCNICQILSLFIYRINSFI